MKTQLIAVTGGDGSGKSTLIQNLKSKLVKRGLLVKSADVWDSLEDSLLGTKNEVQSYLKKISARSRLLFIAHGLQNSIDKMLEEKPNVLLVDSYIYKYAVNEVARGLPFKYAKKLVMTFRKPDQVLYLKVSSKISFARKQSFSEYESQMNFIEFQNKMSSAWELIEREFGPWDLIDASKKPDQVSNVTFNLIDERVL